MGRRNSLPQIPGGGHILRSALGESGGPQPIERKEVRATLPAREAPSTKAKLSVNLPSDLIEEVRDAVDALGGPPYRLSMTAFAENALRAELERLKRAETEGEKFPSRTGPLKPGPRVA